MTTQCWAHSVYGRCKLDGGHDDLHQITQSWSDSECLDPATFVPQVRLPVYEETLIDTAVVDLNPATAPCFSCGCSEAAHHEEGEDGEAMCSKHQCRTWIA